MEKRRKIFDDDGVMVEAVETVKKEDEMAGVPMRRAEKIKPKMQLVNVSDVLDTFAGYLPSQVNIQDLNNKGTCVLCGKETMTELRKVCFDCLKSYANDLYHGAKSAMEKKEQDFTFYM